MSADGFPSERQRLRMKGQPLLYQSLNGKGNKAPQLILDMAQGRRQAAFDQIERPQPGQIVTEAFTAHQAVVGNIPADDGSREEGVRYSVKELREWEVTRPPLELVSSRPGMNKRERRS